MTERLSASDSQKRFDEVINEKKILTIGELADISKNEGWYLGPEINLLDYLMAQRQSGKVLMLQRFPAHESPYLEIYVVNASLFKKEN